MSDVNRDDDLLARATGALRDESQPPVPETLIGRTRNTLERRFGNPAPARARSPFAHPLFRVAAAVAILTCAAAAYVALRRPAAPQFAGNPNPGATTAPPVLRPQRGGGDLPPRAAARVPTGEEGVRGHVRFVGVAPKPQVMSMAANAHCAAHHRGQVIDESVLVNADGTLRNVVVWVSGGLEGRRFAPPKEPAVLDQQGCVYTPHVVTVMAGQRLLVKNSDPFLHNVRAAAAANPPFNFGQPTVDGGKPLVFLSPERMFVKCDIHPWMSAYVHVLDNPFFAVTGADGAFKLPDLPEGRYTVSAWHEVYGEQRQEVAVEPGKPLGVEFTFRSTEQARTDQQPAPPVDTCCAEDPEATTTTFAARF